MPPSIVIVRYICSEKFQICIAVIKGPAARLLSEIRPGSLAYIICFSFAPNKMIDHHFCVTTMPVLYVTAMPTKDKYLAPEVFSP